MCNRQATQPLKDLAKEKFLGTQVVEDVNGEMNNGKRIRGSCKYRRPGLTMARCLGKDALGARHKFTPVDTCGCSFKMCTVVQ